MQGVDKTELIGYLARIDGLLATPATLYVYGSAALILLDEPERTSLDMDVAAPYSRADFAELAVAAAKAGLPINPPDDYRRDHMEWISALRLCLPPPDPASDLVLWQGSRLAVKTAAIPRLIASKLIRYDNIDRGDVQYLCKQGQAAWDEVAAAVEMLPSPFGRDALVRENLANLREDMRMWGGAYDRAGQTASELRTCVLPAAPERGVAWHSPTGWRRVGRTRRVAGYGAAPASGAAGRRLCFAARAKPLGALPGQGPRFWHGPLPGKRTPLSGAAAPVRPLRSP